MDILNLLVKRIQIPFGHQIKDEWINEALKSGAESVNIILTDRALNYFRDENIIAFREMYSLTAMFDLKNPYINTNANMFLYCFKKSYSGSIKYGIYKETFPTIHSRQPRVIVPRDEYPEQYFAYIEEIEKFMTSDYMPLDTEYKEFGILQKNILQENVWNPNRYSKKTLKIKERLKHEKTVELSSVAEIIRPFPLNDRKKTKYSASFRNWSYPVNYEKLREGVMTNIPLQKGDIVLTGASNFFLVYETPNKEIHASPNSFIIRPTHINSEYLFLYLKSEISLIILESLKIGSAIQHIMSSDLKSFPIVVPKGNPDKYRNTFITEYFPINSIQKLIESINEISPKEEVELEDILNAELVEKLKSYKKDVLKEFLIEDLKELNVCFKNKAYKATLILSGSILEAVLIDWVSEIHQKDYFNEEFITRSGKSANLIDYINEIKYLKAPDWAEEADKAHLIRKKRNLVHAKLCLNSDEINEDVCRKVIDYLKEVLLTRNGKMIKNKKLQGSL